MESNGSRLAAAYARLSGAGRRVTVRSLKAEAGCSTDAAAGFLRDVSASVQTPAPPDLSEPLGLVWAAAWRQASDAAREEFGARAEQAVDGQAEAVAEAALADQHRAEAEAARDQAEARAEQVQQEAEARLGQVQARVEALTGELAEAREQAAAAEDRAQAAEQARAEAERQAARDAATADTLREIVGLLGQGKDTPPAKTTRKTAGRPARAS
jgi:hypothetical protein|uniref:KfrA N-terminal DNA-binding domain-containing protein n=2 Tax=Acidipropionibacterium TaxID=1912215 RepID=Q9L458_9ACTN|nr:hypothetical protein [Acidipropionibacterium jensenii]BAB17918.1 unnamed protein product [Acidipropionibacterium acidipropionici]CAB88395.1 hypothetical protein [Acidipropionibacterium jensenii]